MPKTGPVEERTRAQLQRLKWGMVFAPLLLLAPYEVYNLLVVKIEWQEALLDTFVVLVASLTLVQVPSPSSFVSTTAACSSGYVWRRCIK